METLWSHFYTSHNWMLDVSLAPSWKNDNHAHQCSDRNEAAPLKGSACESLWGQSSSWTFFRSLSKCINIGRRGAWCKWAHLHMKWSGQVFLILHFLPGSLLERRVSQLCGAFRKFIRGPGGTKSFLTDTYAKAGERSALCNVFCAHSWWFV